jgi:hypothetical protein
MQTLHTDQPSVLFCAVRCGPAHLDSAPRVLRNVFVPDFDLQE